MSAQCSESEPLIFAYLDAELSGEDLHQFERHISDCDGCCEKLRAEEAFHSALRARLAAPPAPDLVRRRVCDAIACEEAAAARAARRSRVAWLLPMTSVAAAAGALVLFAVHELGDEATPAVPTVAREAVRDLFQPMPSVVEPGSRPELSQAAQEYTRIPVRAPQFSLPEVSLRGFQRGWLLDRRAALFIYEARGPVGRQQVNVYTLDATGLDLSLEERRAVAGRELWVTSVGPSTVTYRDEDGIGYIFTSELGVDELVELVARSDLLDAVSDRLRAR